MIPLHNPLPKQPAPERARKPTLQIVEGGLSATPPPTNRLTLLLPLLRGLIRAMPAGLPTWIYTTLLKPAPLRRMTNALLLRLIPEQVHLSGVTVVLNPRDPVVSSALTLGIYESYETTLIQQFVQPGMCVLDIGANVGYFTAILAHQVGPTGRVTAFEPEPGNYQVLCRTVRANDFSNVQTMRGAVSAAPGESYLFLSEQNQGDHRLYATVGRGSITVPIFSIDTHLPPETILDFVKMDIQGSEGKALQGMRETLRRSPNVRLLMEFWPEGLAEAGTDPLELLETLRDNMGFTVLEVDEKAKRIVPITDFTALIAQNPGRAYTNLLCERRGGSA